MASNGIIVALVVATAGIGLAPIACSSTGGTSPPAPAGMIGGFKDCTTGASGGMSSCPASESKAYGDCIAAACDTQFTECLGPGWTTGSFSGHCADYFTCYNACACGDSTCHENCPIVPACRTCLTGTVGCSTTCKAPPCATASGSSGDSGEAGAECARLDACCAAIVNAEAKKQCKDSHTLLGTNESACKTVADAYKTSLCP